MSLQESELFVNAPFTDRLHSKDVYLGTEK